MPYADDAQRRVHAAKGCKSRWDRWRAVGACGTCGEFSGRFARCIKCRLRAQQLRQRRLERAEKRFCPVHPTVRIVTPGATMCKRCRAQRAGWSKAGANIGGALTIAAVREAITGQYRSVPELARLLRRAERTVRTALLKLRAASGASGWLQIQVREKAIKQPYIYRWLEPKHEQVA